MSKRTVCVVTGSRAEYGLLTPLLREIASDKALRLQVVATGMHLSPEFGLTYREIEADGFTIDAKVEMLLSSDSAVGIAKSMGLGVSGMADAFARLNPDIVVLLGDRFEILAAAQAALVAKIPIGHIHGGETSEGSFDEGIRHAITKMSHWHFVAAEPYRKRVVQMGEAPDRVFCFGAPGLDYLESMKWLDRKALEKSLEMRLTPPMFLVTYHPATLGRTAPADAMTELLAALDEFPKASVVFTYPNADTGGRALMTMVDDWVTANDKRAKAFVSLGQPRYLSLMREADVVIGNSSSGMIEAPALKKAVVNVGERQQGRLRATCIVQANEDRREIASATRKALSDAHQKSLAKTKSLYGAGQASRQIKDTLKTVELKIQKRFFDLEQAD